MGGNRAAIIYIFAQCAIGAVVHPTSTTGIGSPVDGGASGGNGGGVHNNIRYRWPIGQSQLRQYQH